MLILLGQTQEYNGNVMAQSSETVLRELFSSAEKAGLSRSEVTRRAGLQQPTVSRAMRGDCKLSTVSKLAEAAGFRIVFVKDNSLAESLAKGEVF